MNDTKKRREKRTAHNYESMAYDVKMIDETIRWKINTKHYARCSKLLFFWLLPRSISIFRHWNIFNGIWRWNDPPPQQINEKEEQTNWVVHYDEKNACTINKNWSIHMLLLWMIHKPLRMFALFSKKHKRQHWKML